MHAIIGPASIQWLISAGLFYALASVFIYGKSVYDMINREPSTEIDTGIRALRWATMIAYIISAISMLGALITAILEQGAVRNYSRH